jgi:hypothetical protein
MRRERIPDSLRRKLAALIHADHDEYGSDDEPDEVDDYTDEALECDGEMIDAIFDTVYADGFVVSKLKTPPKRVYG